MREEPQQMDQRTRKIIMMHKALHHRDDVDRLYVLRKEGERGLASTEDNVDTSIRSIEDNLKLITATRNNTNNTRINRTTKTKKRKWEENNNINANQTLL